MPHVVIRSHLRPTHVMARFEASALQQGSTHVRLLAIYQAQDENHLLVEAFVSEEPVTQHVALSVRWRADGRLVVGLHELGFPRPTGGIHLAIGHLAGWLCDLDDETVVVHSNLRGEHMLGAGHHE